MITKRMRFLPVLVALIVCACSKEAVSSESLTGTWKVYEQDAYFCGKTVRQGIDYFEGDDVRMTFSEGRVRISIDGGVETYPYSSSGETISIHALIFNLFMRVQDLSEKEMVLDISVPGFAGIETALTSYTLPIFKTR